MDVDQNLAVNIDRNAIGTSSSRATHYKSDTTTPGSTLSIFRSFACGGGGEPVLFLNISDALFAHVISLVQPFTWQAGALFVGTGAGLYYYFTTEKAKLLEKKRAHLCFVKVMSWYDILFLA